MPPRVKVTKEMVADASFEVIRAKGHENLNARTIAEYLGCSTQPVLYSFKTVDEIREAAYRIADAYHTAFIMPKDSVSLPVSNGQVRRDGCEDTDGRPESVRHSRNHGRRARVYGR